MTEVLLDRDGAVAIITLDAPSRRNALNVAMAQELLSICDRIDADSSIGAVVVRALGPTFCSGGDRHLLSTIAASPGSSTNVDALDMIYAAFTRVGALLPPVIAAVGGHAVGAGVNLMLAADLRIFADTAQVITGFADIGVHPGGGHVALLGRVVGRDAVAALTVFGCRIDALRAVELGLAWEAVPAAELDARCIELAAYAGRNPRLARATTRSMRLELGPPALSWPAALELERGMQMWSLQTSEQLRPQVRRAGQSAVDGGVESV